MSSAAATAIRNFSDPSFDAFAEWERSTCMAEVENPYPRLAELRRQGTVHRGDPKELFGLGRMAPWREREAYTVLGYQEALEVLGDPERFSNSILGEVYRIGFGEQNLHAMDPPVHGQYRKVFQKAFLPQHIARWRDELLPSVLHQFIDRFAGDGHAELVRQFCKPFPFHFIFGQLDLPRADQAVFHALATALICPTNPERMAEASNNLGDYLQALLLERRARPGEDMISVLAHAEADGVRVPDEVTVAFLRQLLTAGGGTTFHATGSMLVGLLSDRRQWQAVRADRNLVPAAVKEALRWDSPSMTVTRVATRDAEIGGVDIPRGARLVILVSAINRTPFADSADGDAFDIFRPPEAARRLNLAFSYGPHICIGRHLAQMEMAVALDALMDRLPDLRLDPQAPPPHVRGLITRSPDVIHVIFGPK